MYSRSETGSTLPAAVAGASTVTAAALRALWGRRPGLFAGAALVACLCMPHGVFAGTHTAPAAIKTVADFDTATWAPLLTKGPRPAAYVFTTSYCSTCPLAFDALHTHIRATGKTVELAAVLMDVTGAKALTHVHHYTGVTRVYAFDGFEPEIRQTVDPQWRNVTPYVVMIDHKGAVQRVIGPPSAAQLKAWLP